jgi:hypothetical protein
VVGDKNIKRTNESPFRKDGPATILAPVGAFFVRDNPWEVYEQEKNKLPIDLSPVEYTEAILEISNKLSL